MPFTSTVKPPLTLPEMSRDDFGVVEDLFQAGPGFGALGLLAGQDRLPHAVVERVDHHFNGVAD
jgi:hypothetical protein